MVFIMCLLWSIYRKILHLFFICQDVFQCWQHASLWLVLQSLITYKNVSDDELFSSDLASLILMILKCSCLVWFQGVYGKRKKEIATMWKTTLRWWKGFHLVRRAKYFLHSQQQCHMIKKTHTMMHIASTIRQYHIP